MTRIIDSSGQEHEAIEAEKDLILQDPINGTNRKVFAGKPVPADLEAAYKAAVGKKSSSRSSSSKSSGGKSSGGKKS